MPTTQHPQLELGRHYQVVKRDWETPFGEMLKGSVITGKYVGDYHHGEFWNLEQPDGRVLRAHKATTASVTEVRASA